MHSKHPSHPNTCSFSANRWCASTALTMIDRAPRGVTRIAGAKAYAAKLATCVFTFEEEAKAKGVC